MAFLHPVTLSGRHATLAPLSMEHLDGLVEAARDGELWKLWYTFIPKPELMAAEIERRLSLLAKDSMLPFTVCRRRGPDCRHDDLHERRRREPPCRDRLHLVCAARAAFAAEHRMQADAAGACLRHAGLHRGGVPHAPPEHARAAAPSNAWVRSSTACCARTRSAPTAACATRPSTASSPPNGRPCAPICNSSSTAPDRPWPCGGGPSSWPTRRT